MCPCEKFDFMPHLWYVSKILATSFVGNRLLHNSNMFSFMRSTINCWLVASLFPGSVSSVFLRCTKRNHIVPRVSRDGCVTSWVLIHFELISRHFGGSPLLPSETRRWRKHCRDVHSSTLKWMTRTFEVWLSTRTCIYILHPSFFLCPTRPNSNL